MGKSAYLDQLRHLKKVREALTWLTPAPSAAPITKGVGGALWLDCRFGCAHS